MKKFESVIDTVKKEILSGSLALGSKLPSEKALAQRLKMSVQTVNKALSILVSLGHLYRKSGHGTFVSDNIKIDELLRSRRTNVGILLDAAIRTIAVADSVLARITFYLQYLLSQNHLSWTLISQHDGLDYRDFLDKVDGFITVGDVHIEFIRDVLSRALPTVTFNRDHSEQRIACVYVSPDAIRDLVRTMHAQGHRRFVYVTDEAPKQIYAIRHRFYNEALEELGIPVENNHLVILRNNMENLVLVEKERRFLERADFAFLPSDSLAIPFIRLITHNGFSVPQDLSVCGYDNTIVGRHFSVPVTSIAYNISEACTLTIQTIHEMFLRNKPELKRAVDSWIIFRDSTGKKT